MINVKQLFLIFWKFFLKYNQPPPPASPSGFCRGGSRRPPAPPAPAKRDWYWCYGMPGVLVEGNVSQIFTRCRLFWRQSGFDLRHACHIRGSVPGPLTAACNARLLFVWNYSGFSQIIAPLFAFLSVNSKNEKRTQRGLKKVVGVQGEEEKTFLKSFSFLPRQTEFAQNYKRKNQTQFALNNEIKKGKNNIAYISSKYLSKSLNCKIWFVKLTIKKRVMIAVNK